VIAPGTYSEMESLADVVLITHEHAD